MKCQNCNKEIPDISKFCSYCGKTIEKKKNDSAASSYYLGSKEELDKVNNQNNGANFKPSNKKNEMGAEKMMGMLVFVGVALIIGIVIIVSSNKKGANAKEQMATASVGTSDAINGQSVGIDSNSDAGDDAEVETYSASDDGFVSDCSPSDYIKHGVNEGNTPLHGLAVKQGKWVYYVCQDRVYKHNENGDTYLVDGNGIIYDSNSLNICGDYLYYLSAENVAATGYANIVRVRTDGKEREVVVSDVCSLDSKGSAFVCDYSTKSIFYVGQDYKSSSNLCPKYMKYSIDSGKTVKEYMPDDYNGNPISKIEIVGMTNDAVLAVESYGPAEVLAKINPETLTAQRVELGTDITNFYYAYNDSSFFAGEGSFYHKVCKVDLSSMTITKDVVTGNEPVIACYSDRGDDLLLFRDMLFVDISEFPELMGYRPNEDIACQGSVIDDCLYYTVINSRQEKVFKVGIGYDEFEVIYDPSTTKVIEEK